MGSHTRRDKGIITVVILVITRLLDALEPEAVGASVGDAQTARALYLHLLPVPEYCPDATHDVNGVGAGCSTSKSNYTAPAVQTYI